MILTVDTIEEKCKIGIYEEGKLISSSWQWRKDTGTEVLKKIFNLLKKGNKNLQQISAIVVNRGPGSYTGTRVGITVANALGWSLKIPVVGLNDKDFKEAISEETLKIIKNDFFRNHFPTPIYEK